MNYFIKVFNHTILQLPACMLPPLLLLIIYFLTAQHMGSQCSDQGSNLHPPALEGSLNHWTGTEVPVSINKQQPPCELRLFLFTLTPPGLSMLQGIQ